jgi:hypothetical protein
MYRHFRDAGVDSESNVQKMRIPSTDCLVTHYDLDVLLVVGYRANYATTCCAIGIDDVP